MSKSSKTDASVAETWAESLPPEATAPLPPDAPPPPSKEQALLDAAKAILVVILGHNQQSVCGAAYADLENAVAAFDHPKA